MKTALFRTPPPINKLGRLLLSNRQDYCSYHGYELIHDETPPPERRHFSWAVPETIIRLMDDGKEWVLNTGAEYLFSCFPIGAEWIIENYMTPDQDIFIIGEWLTPLDGKKNPWMGFDENGNLVLGETDEKKMLLCPIGMYIRNTEWSRATLQSLYQDSRFLEDGTFGALPPFIDRFQLGLSIYYDTFQAFRDKVAVGPVREFACLPRGEGAEYDRLRKIMRKIIAHDYSDFRPGSYVTTVWCLSAGVDIPAVTKIVEENQQNIIR